MSSGFVGKLDSYGDVIVANSSNLFAGEKNIHTGTLTTNSGSIEYRDVVLGSVTQGAKLIHTISDDSTGNVINDSVFKFAEGTSNSEAIFKSADNTTANANIGLSRVDNGNKNTISINGANVTLTENNYKGGTIYNFDNSNIKLASDNTTVGNYEFSNVTGSNNKLTFNVIIKDEDASAGSKYLETDRLTIGNGGQSFDFGNIYISGKENGWRGTYTTKEGKDVLDGATFKDENPSQIDHLATGATTSWIYDVSKTENGHSIKMEINRAANENTLYDMNHLIDGTRFFQFSDYDKNGEYRGKQTYNIGKSLDETLAGKFTVSGYDKDKCTISGEIVDSDGVKTGDRGSFFDIRDGKDVDLAIKNVTIANAHKDGNGSVVSNDSTDGKVSISSAIIKDNNSTGDGGAIWNNKGNLIISNSTFNMYDDYTVAKDVDVALANDSKAILQNGSELNLNENDYWGGSVDVVGGHLIGSNIHFDGKNGAKWQQSSGTSTFNNSYVELNDEESFIGGGNLNLINSSMRFGANSISMGADNLYMKDSSINTLNGWLEEHEISSNMNVNGTNHFGIDIAPRLGNLGESDLFTADKIISDSNGTINIADFNFVGLAPIDRHLKFQVFKANSIGDNVKFTATNKEISTPIGYYNIQSAGGGWFTSNLTRYNPQVFRGQVATLASFNNQLMIDDMLLNHVTLDSERLLAQGRNANTYASTLPQFAPYQYKKEDGGLWFKSYVKVEELVLVSN